MVTEVEEFNINPQIIVQAFDVEKTLEEFSLSDIEEFYIEYGGITDPLGQLASSVMNFFESVASSLESAIRSAIHSVESSIRGAISGVESAIKSAISGVESAIKSAIGGVQSLVQSVYSSLQSIGSSILSSISGAVSTITSTISSIGHSILSTVQGVISSVQNVLSNFQKTVTSFIQNISSQIQSTLTSITQSIQSISQSILGALQNISTTIQTTLQNIFSQIQSVLASISQTMQSIVQTITSTMQNISTAIQNTIQNMSQTLSQIATSITSTLQSISQTISSGFQTFLSQLGNILTQVQSMIQNVIQNIQNVATSISTTIQNIFTNIQTFLQNIITQITTSFQGFSQTLQSMFSPIITAIDWIREQVGKIPQLPSLIWEHIKPFIQPLIDTIKDIPSKMAEISKAFQGFINPLVGIGQFFDQIRQKFIDFITSIPDYFKPIADFFGNIAKDPLGWFNENVVKPLADAFSGLGKWIWEHLPDWLKNAITTMQDWFSNAINWITKGWEGFVDWISKIPEHIQNLGKYFYDDVAKPIQDWFGEQVVEPLMGFANWVFEALEPAKKSIQDFLKDPIGSIKSGFEWFAGVLGDLVETIINSAKAIGEKAWSGLTWFFNTLGQIFSQVIIKPTLDILKGVSEYLVNAVFGFVEFVEDKFKFVGEKLTSMAEGYVKTFYTYKPEELEKHFKGLIDRLAKGGETHQFRELLQLIGLATTTWLAGTMGIRGLWYMLHILGDFIKDREAQLHAGLREGLEAVLTPLGFGGIVRALGILASRFNIRISLGWTLKHIASELKKYPDEIGRALIYGMSIWISYPFRLLSNAIFRNYVPVELPSLAELRDITRRHMPIREKFEQHLDAMRRYLALYGYNDEVISWLTTPLTKETVERGWAIIIKDRFAYDRNIPVSLLYELPTPSDFCRMMIHDIIMHPDYFAQVMQMKGYNSDVAMMYYLLHFRYPTLEKLWEFYCRARADMLWLDKEALPEIVTKEENDIITKYGIGDVPIYPAELNVSKNPEAPEIIMKAIKLYAKWWDYAFFNWFKKEGIKFPSDRLIILDLMADIPLRIDARWMYKWAIIKDKDLMKIVTARGMHPKWVETITIAECMNALAEERTFARTGIINTFKEGFMPLDGLSKTLSHLTDVKILGKKVPVRFLEGEVKLLALRAKYDRALDILRDYFRDLLRGVTENIIPFDGMTESLKEEVKAIAQALKLPNLALDEGYYKLYEPVAESLKRVRTVERIRYWYRYMLYRILYRFSEGYMSEEEFNKVIEEIATNAKLTDEEKQVFTEIAQLMYDGFYKKTKADGILRKLSRGAITLDEAKSELLKLGLTEDLVDALIEKYAKTYTLSISTLLSYADEVYIPEDLLKKKLDTLGVPEDEKNIVLEVFKVRPIKDERAKAIRAQIEKFIEGYIDENTLKQELSKLGKLKEEIDIIVQYAKVEKSIEINKLKINAILNRLKRGAITIEEATKELSSYIVDKDVVNALIEKYVRVYTLSIATLISYAEYVDIPEDLLKKKLEILGVPKDEIPIILQVFKIRPLRDEYAKQISETLKQFEEGYIDEEKLKSTLKELGKSGKEIQILVTFAKARRWRHKVEYFVDAILNQLKRGAITIDKAKEELSKYIVDESLIDAMIEKTVRVYTLSIPQLLSYAEYVDIPEEFIKKKLEILGVPEDEIPIILQVFKIRPLKDERAKMIRSVIDAYIDGYIDKELLQTNLKNLGKSPREVEILTEFADFEKSQATAKLAIDAILNRLRRGAITLEEARKELSKYIVDKALIDAMIEKYVRTSVWSPDKLVSMAEYVPIDLEKLVEKANMFGYPEDEVKLYPAYTLARNLNEEIGRIVTELVYLYVYDVIDEETLRKEIDKVRTLNGEVKKYGVDWIVIDDIEKELIVQRAKLRKLREQAKS